MGKNRKNLLWGIFFPIILFLCISNGASYLIMRAYSHVGIEERAPYWLVQIPAVTAGFLCIYGFYRSDRKRRTSFHRRNGGRRRVFNIMLTLLIGAAAGYVLNLVIGAWGLAQYSSGFSEVNGKFFAGQPMLELLGAGCIIPLVEEILYRGIVYARLSDVMGRPFAVIFSALLFGILHLNLVQFVYAAVLGVLLAVLLELCHNLIGAMCAHVGANVFTILRTETSYFDWLRKSGISEWFWMAVFAGLALVLTLILWRWNRVKGEMASV